MNHTNKNRKGKPARPRFLDAGNLIFLVILIILFSTFISPKIFPVKTYSDFYRILRDEPAQIKSIVKIENMLQVNAAGDTAYRVYIPENDPALLDLIKQNVKDFSIKPPSFLAGLIVGVLPFLLLIGFWWFMMSRGEQAGGKLFSFGKIRPKMHTDGRGEKITFADVAGVDEAKEELKEVIEFLKDPKKFQRLGGKIPKGVLLVGPPGCGKTLIAKAVATEAGVQFFSISGSDFVEMFVGVGASRVRDLFEQGRRAAIASGKGAIIFIDEIDAVGRLRFAGIGGGHDEREQTLNQLLVEMDGFDTTQGLILIAATNRPDTLDPALLRPGRFDRNIVVNFPDILGREAILKVHTRKIKLSPTADLKSIARQTPGYSGADLANLCNEAALLAARNNKESVEMEELEKAVERVMMGPEKKSRVMSKREKDITATHEAGHALLSLLIPEADPLKKVSIIPRGLAGGYTFTPPLEDKHYYTKKELVARIVVSLGGRAAEELVFNEFTTGAKSDLEFVTMTARRMVMELGMSEKLGHMTLGRRESMVFLGRDMFEEKNYSEETARQIDEEIRKVVDNAFVQAKGLLEKNIDKLKLLSAALFDKEVLDDRQVRTLLGFPEVTPPTNSV